MAKDTSLWNTFGKNQFLLLASDLRTYRRAPIPKQMFVLVLDYTCLRDCQWKEAIIPHLQWAYTERASICLIQVGIATTDKKEALCARQIMASGISTPRFRSAFGMAPGKATPLAHGLELAKRTLV